MLYRSAPFIIFQALLLSAISAGSVLASEVFVSLKAEVKISQPDARLGDVADIVATDVAEKRRLESLKIAKLPSVGTAVRLSRSEIEYGLSKASNEKLPIIVWGGSENVLVSSKSQSVSLAPGIDAAAAFLFNRLGGNAQVSLRMIHGVDSVEMPPGSVVVRPDFSSIHTFGAYIDVPLIVEIEGLSAMQTSVRFQVIRHSKIHDLANAELNENSESSDEPLQFDKETSRTDRSNHWVTKDQAVTLLIETGGVRIETSGMALNDANKGEKVRVRRISGGAEIVGRVMQRGVVLVDEI
jgi:hypothetical protein